MNSDFKYRPFCVQGICDSPYNAFALKPHLAEVYNEPQASLGFCQAAHSVTLMAKIWIRQPTQQPWLRLPHNFLATGVGWSGERCPLVACLAEAVPEHPPLERTRLQSALRRTIGIMIPPSITPCPGRGCGRRGGRAPRPRLRRIERRDPGGVGRVIILVMSVSE